jgi:hypothetical protein
MLMLVMIEFVSTISSEPFCFGFVRGCALIISPESLNK